jgi:RNA polymerase sigma factor (sigma-70 family)
MRTQDSYFVYRCLNGETEAFAFLVDKYRESVFALAYGKLRNFDDAEDVTQEVFVKAYKNLRSLRRYDSFAIWLHSMTNNLCIDWLRSRHHERKLIEKATSTEDSLTDSENDDPRIELINKALDILPEIYRQVLTLYYLGEMNCEEIAKTLGISPPAIRQRLSRARSELKEEVLAMMSQTFAHKKLPVGFTFRIVEAIKHIRINPISSKPLPWGISLATGIIIAVLSIGTHLTSLDRIGTMSGFPLPSDARVQRIGEIPVDVLKISSISVISNQHLSGNGLGYVVPSLQNALFMAPQAGDTWTKKADMPTARAANSSSVVNGKIYVIGGWDDNGAGMSTVEEYDPVINKWTTKANMPTPRQGIKTEVVNGKIYAMTDYFKITPVEEYDPKTNIWKQKANIPWPGGGAGIAVLDNKIYVIGGWNSGHVANVAVYDPETDKWENKNNLPVATANGSASVVKGKIYLVGGWVLNAFSINTVWEYNPITDSWRKMADMPTARLGHTTSVLNGKIYAIGGETGELANVRKALRTVEVYDPEKNQWETKNDMPKNLEWHSASVINNKIYIFGGSEGYPIKFESTVFEYDPGEGQSINFKGKLPTTWGETKLAQSK